MNNKLSDDQARRFADAARSLGADEDEAAFRAKLGVIARQRQAPEPKPAAEGKKPRRRIVGAPP